MNGDIARNGAGGIRSGSAAGPIHVLDEHVANKIAAGEVIERPASVVKELVENALDAGARRIEVEIKAGGKEYIRVTDDGEGIRPAEVPLAFERHATSKIARAEDLFDVGTLGFRGEALPSIAAVAEVEVRSRRRGETGGVGFTVEAGESRGPEPVGTPVGTSIVVRRLFFNTPARYKFLRSDGAERRRIADVVARMGLAWPTVSFRFVADERELLHTPGDGELLSAIGAVYGSGAVQSLVPVRFDQDGLRVDGYVSKPDTLHGNRDRMSLFLNQRRIESSSLLHAIQRGYETLLPPRRFPLAVLHLTVDARSVDVNVHPAKAEVRFRDDGAVYRAVMRGVRYALLEANLIGGVGEHGGVVRGHVAPPLSAGARESAAAAAETMQPAPSSSYTAPTDAPAPSPEKRLPPPTPSGAGLHAGMYEAARRQKEAEPVLTGGAEADGDARAELRTMAIIGQLQRTFILGETRSALWIVDQHVAHERILYERYLDEGGEADGVQRLLVPVVITLTPDRLGLVERFSEQLEQLGFELQSFGGASYAVRGVPVALTKARDEEGLTALLEDVLDACVRDGRWDAHEAAAALSCRAAVKAGDVLTREQMQQLVTQLADADNPFACPHGRPVVIELSRFDLERRFGRR